MERIMLTLVAMAIAFLLDWLIGDPPGLPHPVRLLGLLIGLLEKLARRFFIATAGLKLAGALIVLIVTGLAGLAAYLLLIAAYRLHPAVGLLVETYLVFAMLAGGDLRNHVVRVSEKLQAGDLGKARIATAMLVSRNTETLGERGLSRAALESLFENSADGVVAPLLFAALGGPVAAVIYKAVNTLDSMLGYRTREMVDIGYAAAKTDDLLSYIPARLTALLLVGAGLFHRRARAGWRVLREDRDKHESPNSAWPEAAAAGVLGLSFGGSDRYGDEFKARPVINSRGREPLPADIERGLTLYRRTVLLAFIFCMFLAWLLWIPGGLLF
jgi:adenosylcobinamide-phosphate synthase